MSTKISVCIATWCRKDYLKEIIKLLENQSIPQYEYEIIVCDSYSKDGTDELMKELSDTYTNIKYINTEKNVLAVKRNIGINAANSPIIVFMDDDVFPTYKFIESHLTAHIESVNTVYCGQVRFPKEWVKKSNYYRYRDDCHLTDSDYTINNNLPFNKIVVMNLSFKKDEIINKVGYVDERFIGYGSEDTEFGYRICLNGLKLVYLNEALAYHYENSLSVINFGEKVFRSGRDGARVLNLINPEILKNTKLFLLVCKSKKDNFKIQIEKYLFRILINKPMATIISKFLISTDKIGLLYCRKLYRYYFAYKFKQGVLAQKNITLSLKDVENGWYEK